MYLVWLGLVLVALRWLEIGPVAGWSWWWVLSPLAVALVWFEFLEQPLGRDRRQVETVEFEERRRKRVDEQFREMTRPASRR